MFDKIKTVLISGKEVWPIVEGGKGIGVSNGNSAGAFAAAGAVGTFSGANAKIVDDNGETVPLVYRGKTRIERHHELVEYSIKGAISQAKIAHSVSQGKGRIHMNVLWEMSATQKILHGVLSSTKGLIHGITCGAGMPYKLAEIAAQYKVYYYPIVSSMRAFKALWQRSYRKIGELLLGGVVYEDPWLAGGHNGLSNSDKPDEPQSPFPKVKEIRAFMNEVGLNNIPIIIAGGVWRLKEWAEWFDNNLIGPIAFQFGTRPLLTKESPISDQWKQKLLTLKNNDVALNKFSPTGFYSSAVKNNFITELQHRSTRQLEFRNNIGDEFCYEVDFGKRGRKIYIKQSDSALFNEWIAAGYTEMLKTPDSTIIFVTKEKSEEIRNDQINCIGCLSHCKFSNWKDHDNYTTGFKPDPRSFCIQKTLNNIIDGANVEQELMFSGHNAYRFQSDPLYKNGHIPSVKELVDTILQGN